MEGDGVAKSTYDQVTECGPLDPGSYKGPPSSTWLLESCLPGSFQGCRLSTARVQGSRSGLVQRKTRTLWWGICRNCLLGALRRRMATLLLLLFAGRASLNCLVSRRRSLWAAVGSRQTLPLVGRWPQTLGAEHKYHECSPRVCRYVLYQPSHKLLL